MRAAPERREPVPGVPSGGRWRRLLPIAVLGLGFALFFVSGADDYLSFEVLRQHRAALQAWVEAHTPAAIGLYFAAYVAVVAFSLPGGALMTLIGGFLFGTWLGGAVVVVAATLGATLLFLAARTAFGGLLRAKAGPGIQRMEAGFRENAMCYLLVLRLVPLFPFFLVNLAPAFLGVPLPTFVAATFVGIIPGTFVYAGVGSGLGAVLEAGREPDLGLIYQPEILLPLLALAALACVPLVYKRLKARRRPEGE
jgi:uncharacterized membrane protein YdjX (TVP38/TMEM64 family)